MKHYIWAFLWAVVVLVLISMPGDSTRGVPHFEGMDKLVHTGFFFVFTVLLYYGSIKRNKTTRPSWDCSLKVIFVSLFFAVLTEFIQLTIFTHRTAEIWDLFADVVGTGMGVFAYLVFHHIKSHET